MHAEILSTSIVSRHPSYHGWGTVARCRDGTLVMGTSASRQAHVCPYGRIHLLRSTDEGATWSDPQIITDGPLDDRDTGVLETSKGTLLVAYFTSVAWMWYLYRHESGGEWLSPETAEDHRAMRDRVNRELRVRDHLGDWIIRSTDGGKSWSKAIPSVVSSPHGPIELSDGTLMYAGKLTVSSRQWVRGSSHEEGPIGVAVSRDDGQSWELLATVPCAEGHRDPGYHEPHMVECADGTLVLQIRNHHSPGAKELWQSESTDGGKTWSVPQSTGIVGEPPHFLRLSDDRLLLTYGYRFEPYGNHARISSDNGRTWSDPLVLSDDGVTTDLGYPSTVELRPGEFLTMWYEKLADNPLAVIRQARWNLVE